MNKNPNLNKEWSFILWFGKFEDPVENHYNFKS